MKRRSFLSGAALTPVMAAPASAAGKPALEITDIKTYPPKAWRRGFEYRADGSVAYI